LLRSTLLDVPTEAAATQQAATVLLRLDGVLHTSDLPAQSFARHLTEQLPADLVRPMIAGMRGFLERKPELVPTGIDLGPAEDGDQAVERLALAAGLSAAQIAAAWQASRMDLAASAWAVDPPDCLAELLTDIGANCSIKVFAEPADPAAPAVLDALGLPALELVPAPPATAVAALLAGGQQPRRILVIGTRWIGQLDAAAATGCTTALLDRYRLGRGAPDWRAADLSGLSRQIRSWVAAGVGAGAAGGTG
jgi:hypothetical protein